MARTLRRIIGRTRYGLYALGGDGAEPVLLLASSTWPPPQVNVPGIIRERVRGPAPPVGRTRRVPPARADRAERVGVVPGLDLVPLDAGEQVFAVLAMWAPAKSSPRKIQDVELVALSAAVALHLRCEEQKQLLDQARGFQESLLAALPIGVFSTDAHGRITYLSPAAERILGCATEEAVGSDCLRIFRPAGIDENPLVRGLRGRSAKVELFITDRDGIDKPVWIQMARIRAAAGQDGPGLLVLIRDTSEERAYEEDQRRRERLASIGELSAGVAHEIRNPLTGIGNCAQVLRDRIPPDDPRQRFVRIILDEAARLNRIVEGLLTFARPGRPQLRESPLPDLMKRAVDLEREQIDQQGIATEIKVQGKIPPIYIDPEQIVQVLLNIVRNAIEAMPNGGRLILECSVVRRRPHLRRGTGQRKTDRIRYDRNLPMKRYIRLRIADTGAGIPRDALPRIFDPFFTTRSKGTGLGLSISQSIVTEHGGFISAHSIETKGTSVTIDLPVERRAGERRKD